MFSSTSEAYLEHKWIISEAFLEHISRTPKILQMCFIRDPDMLQRCFIHFQRTAKCMFGFKIMLQKCWRCASFVIRILINNALYMYLKEKLNALKKSKSPLFVPYNIIPT
jgi:hypothetical protein